MGGGVKRYPPPHFELARTPQAGMMGNMEQEQYYIATEDGKTEGPYSFASLEASYTNGKITQKALVCIAGGQEWVQFGTVLEHKWKAQARQREAIHPVRKNNYDGAVNEWPVKEIREIPFDSSKALSSIFRFVSVICFVLSVVCIILLASTHKGEPIVNTGFAVAGSVTFILSGLGFIWCAKVIELLSRAVDLLAPSAKRK